MIPIVGVAGSFRGRRWLMRVFGWLALAVVVPVLGACAARSLEPPELVPEPTGFGSGPVILNRNVGRDGSTTLRRTWPPRASTNTMRPSGSTPSTMPA